MSGGPRVDPIVTRGRKVWLDSVRGREDVILDDDGLTIRDLPVRLETGDEGAFTIDGVPIATGTTSVDAFDYIPASEHAAIIARTSIYDATEALRTAFDAAAAQKATLRLQGGLYNVLPGETFTGEGGPVKRAFALRSGLSIMADPGATLRVVNGVSTDAVPVWMCMFGTNEVLQDVTIIGLTMDMNGDNNPISPDRGSGTYSLLNQSQIYVSGTPGGVAARIDNAYIERCRFINCPGTNCLVMAQTNVAGVTLGRGWRVLNNEFLNNGLDTNDHSSIYAWADDVLIQGNTLENDDQYGDTGPGGNVTIEVHGSNARILHNIVRRYYQALWIDANNTSVAESAIIDSNVFLELKAFGVMFFGAGANSITKGTLITKNVFQFDNLTHPGVDLKIGVGCKCDLAQTMITIASNRFISGGVAVASAGVVVEAGMVVGEKHDRILIEGNSAYGTTFGEIIKPGRVEVSMGVFEAVDIGQVTVRNNYRYNLSQITESGAFSTPIGLYLTFDTAALGTVDELIIDGNLCDDDRGAGAECDFGTRLEGLVGRLDYGHETFRGMVTADYSEASLTVTRRVRSYDARNSSSGTAAPGSGNWLAGDVVWNAAPTAGGPPGWVCVAAGTPGTWKAMANLAA